MMPLTDARSAAACPDQGPARWARIAAREAAPGDYTVHVVAYGEHRLVVVRGAAGCDDAADMAVDQLTAGDGPCYGWPLRAFRVLRVVPLLAAPVEPPAGCHYGVAGCRDRSDDRHVCRGRAA